MNPDLHRDITDRLTEFDFKHAKGGWLQGGKCPDCGKKELYTSTEHPWVLRCGRLNKCGWVGHVKELYPDLFESWSDRYQKLEPKNPRAAADAYMRYGRGFDVERIGGWYTQESFYDPEINEGSATVRFPLANGHWERIIDKPHRFGSRKAHMRKGMSFQGLWWQPPSLDSKAVNEIVLVEGIFDAIALEHNGFAAVSLMSSNNYPEKALAELEAARGGKDCTLTFALDSDKAGKSFTRKFIRRARDAGWPCGAMQIPQSGKHKRDWNDLHQRTELTEKNLEDFRYHGALLIAESATEKALLIYGKEARSEFYFDFENRLYWFKLDLDRFNKEMESQDNAQYTDRTEEEKRNIALKSSGVVRPIANCLPTPLYYQANAITDESWYYYRVDFPHDGASVKNTFSASQISSAAEFKKRLLSIAPGAMYSGTSGMLDRIIEDQLYNIKRVDTVDYIGYSLAHGCYVFGNVAVKDGKLYDVTDEDYFEIGKLSIKSLNSSFAQKINRDLSEYKTEWVQLLWQAFGVKGLAALTFWFGTLFAEQIRAKQANFPFLEIVGEAGAGKSTLLEFLWKLFGRPGYEGIDPNKSTLSARARNFAQVSCMPVSLIESDSEKSDGSRNHARMFDWDELKTAYNGRITRSRGMATGGNETYEPPFRGAIVISQNTPVAGSVAILSRIIHLYFDRSTQTPESGEAADALKFMPAEDVSGFILDATKREKEIMATVLERTPEYLRELRGRGDIKMPRLVETHAQMLALADAIQHVIKLTDAQQAALKAQFKQMAVDRQQVVDDDHPLVQEFWEAFDFLNDRPGGPWMDHSADDQLIAVNLNHFVQKAGEFRQQIPQMSDLKKVLKTSKGRKFFGRKKVNSVVRRKEEGNPNSSSTVDCWVFEKG